LDKLKLPTIDKENGLLNVVIETPKHSRNKYKYDKKSRLFKLKITMPAGENFPYDFGFLPKTEGEDGDPLDILVLMEDPVYPGCIVPARLIGVIEAEQTEKDGKTERNDRLIAVSYYAGIYKDIKELKDIVKPLLKEIESFFITYNKFAGKKFRPIGRKGAEKAKELILIGMKRFKDKK
jgi:inorganic pyrophosphatase